VGESPAKAFCSFIEELPMTGTSKQKREAPQSPAVKDLAKKDALVSVARAFMDDFLGKRISVFASSAAYFFFMALIPLAVLVYSILPLTSLSSDDVVYFLMGFAPSALEGFVNDIVETAWKSAGSGVITLSFLATLWLASVAMMAIIHGLDEVYKANERRSYFAVRGLACLYTVIFLVALILLVVVMVYGKSIALLLSSVVPLAQGVASLIDERYIISALLLIVIFQCCYTFLPAGRRTFRAQLPGALFSSFVWTVTSAIFSAFVSRPGAYSIYGSLAVVIITLTYIYMMLYIVLLGAEVNVFLALQMQGAKKGA
jgi:membrane protein